MSDDNETPTRSLRPRRASVSESLLKRRSLELQFEEEVNIEDIYKQVNAKTDFQSTPLETIYESPKGKNDGLRDVMGVVKLKRHFRFTPFYNPSKIKVKMRKTKSKKLKRVGASSTSDFVITLEQVEKALQHISDDENDENWQPKRIYETENCKLMDTEGNQIENDKTTEDKAEKITSTLVEMKDNELIEVYQVRNSMTCDFMQFDNDCDMLSPGRQVIDKSKRHKRRSGRVQPLCLNNVINDFSLEHVDKKICNDNVINDFSLEHVDKKICNDSTVNRVVDNSLSSSMEYNLSQNILASTVKPKPKSKSYTQNRPPRRRNSGINRSIYKNSFVCSESPESLPPLEVDENLENNYVNKRLLSPTALLNQLSLNSPEPVKKSCSKRARRKSARLSFGGDDKPCLGSVWLEKSPNAASLAEKNVGIRQPIDPVDIIESEIKIETKYDINSKPPSDKDSSTDGVTNSVVSNVSNCSKGQGVAEASPEFADSPILTAIFDCEARLNKDRKFTVRKGSNIKLSHFISC